MKPAFAFFARAAEIDASGAFHVLYGGLNKILAPSVPVMIQPLTLLLNIVSDQDGEVGSHNLTLDIYRPGGEKLLPEPMAIELKLVAPDQESQLPSTATVIIGMGLALPEYGKYEFRICRGEVSLFSLPLHVGVQK
jgi:hypothetical protein